MKKLLKNFSTLSLGEATSRALLFLATIFLAKILEPENFGKLSFAQAHVSYFALLVNFGFDYVGIRDVSNDSQLSASYVHHIVSLRIVFAAAAFLLLTLTLAVIQKSVEVKIVSFILGIGLFLHALDLTWLYQALQRMLLVAALKFARSLFLLVLLAFSIFFPNNLFWVAACFVFSSALVAVYFLKDIGIPKGLRLSIDRRLSQRLLQSSFPTFLMLLTVSIYFNVDVFLLGILATDQIVGVYSAAYKLVLAGITPVTVWLSACSPELSKQPLVLSVWARFAAVNIVIGCFLTATLYFYFESIMSFLFGSAYNAPPQVFQLLSMIPLASAIAGSFANPLTFWGFPSRHLAVTSIGAAVNVLFNLLLIPKYSMAGAAIATITAELSVAVAGFVAMALSISKNRVPVVASG